MESLELNVPLKLPLRSKKSPYFYLNLNVYRNAHYQVLNKAKQTFEEYIWNQIRQLPKFKWLGLLYTLYPGSSRRHDISNVCCIVDKFFCDALVNAQVIPDDNADVVRKIVYEFGKVDKENPHVNIYIEGELA